MVPIGFQITRSNHDLKYIVIWKCLLSILRDQTYHYGYPWLVDNPSLLLLTFLMKSWYFSVLPHGGGGHIFLLPVLLLTCAFTDDTVYAYMFYYHFIWWIYMSYTFQDVFCIGCDVSSDQLNLADENIRFGNVQARLQLIQADCRGMDLTHGQVILCLIGNIRLSVTMFNRQLLKEYMLRLFVLRRYGVIFRICRNITYCLHCCYISVISTTYKAFIPYIL